MAAMNGAEHDAAATTTNSTNSPGRTGRRACSSRVSRLPLASTWSMSLPADADRVLDERGVLLDGGPEVDVLLAPRAGRGCRRAAPRARTTRLRRPTASEGEAAADEDHGEPAGVRSSEPLLLGDLAGGRDAHLAAAGARLAARPPARRRPAP